MAEKSESDWKLACLFDSLVGGSARAHVNIDGRFVTVINHENHLYCLDSSCYHNGGPLGVGDIETLGDNLCIICPWHRYSVSLSSGVLVYKKLEYSNGKLVPGGFSCTPNKQRTHEVENREGNVYVRLNKDPTEFSSDLVN